MMRKPGEGEFLLTRDHRNQKEEMTWDINSEGSVRVELFRQIGQQEIMLETLWCVGD